MPDKVQELKSLLQRQSERIDELEGRVAELERKNQRERDLLEKSTPSNEN